MDEYPDPVNWAGRLEEVSKDPVMFMEHLGFLLPKVRIG